MSQLTRARYIRRRFAAVLPVGAVGALLILLGVAWAPAASAAQAPVVLGNAAPFAVLAGASVTSMGHSVISGDLGVSPGTAVTGFPPGTVIHGSQAAGPAAAPAQADLASAYQDAAGRSPAATVPADLKGKTLPPGVYQAPAMDLSGGTVTLDAHGDPHALFIFQAGSSLATGAHSRVKLAGDASACNVFWQVGGSATLGAGSSFAGTVMAQQAAAVGSGATVNGRILALASDGIVTLDDSRITAPECAAASPSPTPASASSGPAAAAAATTATATTATATPTDTATATPTDTPTATPTGTPTPTDTSTATPFPTSTSTAVPLGAPQTGAGGASRPGNSALIAVGAMALAGAAVAMGLAIRRSRGLPAASGPGHGIPGGDW